MRVASSHITLGSLDNDSEYRRGSCCAGLAGRRNARCEARAALVSLRSNWFELLIVAGALSTTHQCIPARIKLECQHVAWLTDAVRRPCPR